MIFQLFFISAATTSQPTAIPRINTSSSDVGYSSFINPKLNQSRDFFVFPCRCPLAMDYKSPSRDRDRVGYGSRSPTPKSRHSRLSRSPSPVRRPRSATRSQSPAPRRNGRYRSESKSRSRSRSLSRGRSESPLRGSTKVSVRSEQDLSTNGYIRCLAVDLIVLTVSTSAYRS